MTKDEALKLALEALNTINASTYPYREDGTSTLNNESVELSNKAITAIKELLAQPEQEPVAKYSDIVSDGGLDPRNTTPPKREWDGLNWGDLPEEWVGDHKFFAGATWAAKMLEKKNK